MTKKNFWEFVGELITTLNLDVPPHVIIGASVSVLDRTVDGLPIGLSHGLMQGSHAVYIFTFTALACLVAALTWGGLLLSLTPFLETKGVAASFLRYLITGLFMAAVPLFFNGPEQMLLGILAAILFKILAAYELSPYTRGQENDYLVSELGHLNSDGGSREIREGGHLVLLNLGGLFPLARWSRFVGPLVTNVVRRSVMAAAEFQLFYQGLWYNKKYRRTRKKVRHFLETPIRLRRYWYLTCRWEIRAELAWFGVPFRQYPQFKCGNTFLGLVLRKASRLVGYTIHLFRLESSVRVVQGLVVYAIRIVKRLWNDRPSAIHGFVDLFQPEAPVYVRGGYTITPPARRPRLVNLISDMEVFASRGSSLLVFMFLIWSFFARILLVVCFLGTL